MIVYKRNSDKNIKNNLSYIKHLIFGFSLRSNISQATSLLQKEWKPEIRTADFPRIAIHRIFNKPEKKILKHINSIRRSTKSDIRIADNH